jgi:spore coat protein U-like protein
VIRRWLPLVAIAGWLLGAPGPVEALTCTVTASDIAFGSVDPLAGADVDVTANIQVSCSDPVVTLVDPTVGVCVFLDAGSGGSDGTTWRRMLQGSEILPYNLYKDAARTLIWGSETAFSSSGAQRVVVTLTGLLPSTGSATLTMYGRIPGTVAGNSIGAYQSTFTNGARIRYSLTDTLACNGVAGVQATDTFVATASIAETCIVEADDLDFGATARLDTEVLSDSEIRTSCSSALAYSIALGTGGGGSFAARRMVHGSDPLATVGYQLYADGARVQVWGDGTAGTVTTGGTGDGSPQPSAVYGRVPPQATPRPGDYADTVVVTVTY